MAEIKKELESIGVLEEAIEQLLQVLSIKSLTELEGWSCSYFDSKINMSDLFLGDINQLSCPSWSISLVYIDQLCKFYLSVGLYAIRTVTKYFGFLHIPVDENLFCCIKVDFQLLEKVYLGCSCTVVPYRYDISCMSDCRYNR